MREAAEMSRKDSGAEHKKCSTRFPGGNQVDGLPPASHLTVRIS